MPVDFEVEYDIKAEGFQPIERPTVQKREIVDDGWDNSNTIEREDVFSSLEADLAAVESFDRSQPEADDVESSGDNSSPLSSFPILLVDQSFVTLHPETGYQENATHRTTSAPRHETGVEDETDPNSVQEHTETNDVVDEQEENSTQFEVEKEEEDVSFVLPTDPEVTEQTRAKSDGGLFSWLLETMAENDKASYNTSEPSVPDPSTGTEDISPVLESDEPPTVEVKSDQAGSSRPCKYFVRCSF